MNRKIFNFLFLLSSTVVIADEVVCKLNYSQPYDYIGDVSGKYINTKEDFFYKCVRTTTVEGPCLKWGDTIESSTQYTNEIQTKTYFKTENYEGSIGTLLSVINSMDKANKIWSGWHGICTQGADDGNWDWLSDPYVLAGYALTSFGIYASSEAASASEAVDEARKAGTTWENIERAKKFADAAMKVKKVVDYATCAVEAGIDLAQMIEEYNSDDMSCDPVDEFCDEINQENEKDEQIFTIPREKYNEFMEENKDDSELMKFLLILNEDDDVVTLKVVNPGVSETDAESMKEAQEKAKALKEKVLKIKALISSVQLSLCVASVSSGNEASTSSSDDDGEDVTSTENLTKMALQQGLSAWNPAVGMAFSIGSRLYESYQTIDTCSSQSDASNKGTRHEATYHAIKADLCHLVQVEKKGDEALATYKKVYKYCCYDDVITRILAEQLKAQFAHDWQHCTDITLQELQEASFTQCDADELKNSIDGVELDIYATTKERMMAYQFTHKCIDTREIVDQMMKKFGGDDILIDESMIQETLKEFSGEE